MLGAVLLGLLRLCSEHTVNPWGVRLAEDPWAARIGVRPGEEEPLTFPRWEGPDVSRLSPNGRLASSRSVTSGTRDRASLPAGGALQGSSV